MLVADDDDESRVALARAVQALGYECLTAPDGEVAWQMVVRDAPDVVLTDGKMPRMNGYELCRRIRGLGGNRYVFVVLITGLGDKPHLLQAMQAGADEFLGKPIDIEELQARLRAAERQLTANRDLRHDSDTARAEARIDALTTLPNRRALDEDLERACSVARRYERPFAIAIADIDGFKAYNDRFGHLAGDDTLRAVAHALDGSKRVGDVVYRYGGEEFVVLLPDQLVDGGCAAAERARLAVAGTKLARSPEAGLTVSLGVTVFDPADSAISCLARADGALLVAKRRGKNQVALGPRDGDRRALSRAPGAASERRLAHG